MTRGLAMEPASRGDDEALDGRPREAWAVAQAPLAAASAGGRACLNSGLLRGGHDVIAAGPPKRDREPSVAIRARSTIASCAVLRGDGRQNSSA